MRMAVVQVRIVRMRMDQPLVPVPVGVRFDNGFAVMAVLVVLVMNVAVLMLQRLVFMRVLVALGEVKPQAHAHQGARDEQTGRRLFMQQRRRRPPPR